MHKDKEECIAKSPKCYILSNKRARIIKLVTIANALLLLALLLRIERAHFLFPFKKRGHFHSGAFYAGNGSEIQCVYVQFQMVKLWSNN